jgi:hypothetical protein
VSLLPVLTDTNVLQASSEMDGIGRSFRQCHNAHPWLFDRTCLVDVDCSIDEGARRRRSLQRSIAATALHLKFDDSIRRYAFRVESITRGWVLFCRFDFGHAPNLTAMDLYNVDLDSKSSIPALTLSALSQLTNTQSPALSSNWCQHVSSRP